MTPELRDRLDDLRCHIERLIILPLMEDSDEAADFLCEEVWEVLPNLLSFTDEQQGWYDETIEDEDQITFLNDIGITGIFFSTHGRIFKDRGDGSLIPTCASAVEIGYAESYDKLEAAINDVLDRIEPRLVEKK